MTEQLYFDDVAPGQELPRLTKGPLGEIHLFRWSAAMENWHRIHYDRRFAQEQDKLPDLLVNGSLKQQFIVQIVKDWAGRDGWVWKVGFQFRAMNTVGDTLHVWGKVKSDGTKWAGQGFTCWQYSVSGSAKTGVYQINFDVSFSSEPCVIATQHYPTDSNSSNSWGNTRDNAMVARVYNNWCQIVTGDGDGDRKWRSFHFIAIGPV